MKATFFPGQRSGKQPEFGAGDGRRRTRCGQSFLQPSRRYIANAGRAQDVVKAHQVITEAIQRPVMLFRPPTGVVDDERAKALAVAGYPAIAMYDVTTLDWDISNSADDIVNGVMTKTQKGSVILLHMLDDIHTIEALPE